MNRALIAAAAAVLLFAGVSGCGDDDEDPAVESTPVGSTAPEGSASLSGQETECKDEIVRQMSDPTQITDDTPPECEGVSDERIGDLAEIAGEEVAKDSPEATP